MNILGIVDIKKPTHDNSVVILSDGKILYAEAGERATRIKHDDNFPISSLTNAFSYTKLKAKDIDYLAIASPDPKFSSLIFARNYGIDTLRCALNIFKNDPLGFSGEVFKKVKKFLYRGGYVNKDNGLEILGLSGIPYVKVCHQTSHAAAAYYGSGFKERCLSISLDGCGPTLDGRFISGSVFVCESGQMTKVDEVPPYATFGGLYSAITQVLGLKAGDGEYKTMGLASYGDPEICYEEIKKYYPYFKNGKWFVSKYWIDSYTFMEERIYSKTRLFSILSDLRKNHKDEDVAAGLQKVFEERVLEYLKYLSEKYECNNFTCAGGIFLNVVLNRKLLEQDFCKKLFVYPNAGDCGISLGAAYYLYNQKTNKVPRKINLLYFGIGFKEKQYKDYINKYKDQLKAIKCKNIAKYTAKKLTGGKVIGWFQGRSEWGPRALGNRSVVADPRKKTMKDRINQTLKARDWFMPFAPSMLDEYKEEYFELVKNKVYFMQYMLLAFKVKKGKGKFPAAMHIDGTSRPQTVKKSDNPLYYQLIKEFYNLTGVPAILNTSFNKHGLPIVNTPQEAIEHLLWGCVDSLVIGNYYIERKYTPSL